MRAKPGEVWHITFPEERKPFTLKKIPGAQVPGRLSKEGS